MKYRPEIDGLRAVAVVPVMLFHAGFESFSGGFIGVDVFFVISGYLITTIIIDDLKQGAFSIGNFFERRVRRLLPALFFVMAACIPFAWMWMLPDELENFGQSLVATTLFSNNLLLWLTSGYWSLPSDFKPLLHTWSLAVEEQYYLIFPFVMIFLWRFCRGRALYVLLFAAGASLILSEWGWRHVWTANFLLFPFRIWEILAGAICAWHLSRHAIKPSTLGASVGVGAVITPMVIFSTDTPIPSIYALVPVLGTIFIISFCNNETPVGRVLSYPLLVGIGLISYSAYLWHQPVFAFFRLRQVVEPDKAVFIFLIVLSLVLAYFTWKFVERPIKNRKTIDSRTIIIGSVVSCLALSSLGLVLHLKNGVPTRYFAIAAKGHLADMLIEYNNRVFAYQQSNFPSNGKRNILVVGHSFARDFVNILVESGVETDFNIVYRSEFLPSCDSNNASLKPSANFTQLVASADLLFLSSRAFSVGCWRQDIASTKALGAGQVMVIGPKNFGYSQSPMMQLGTEARRKARIEVLPGVVSANEYMKEILPPDLYIDIIGIVSNGTNRMPVFTDEGDLISPDKRHLTRAGARFVGRKLFGHSALNWPGFFNPEKDDQAW